jgi:hypothetical protein
MRPWSVFAGILVACVTTCASAQQPGSVPKAEADAGRDGPSAGTTPAAPAGSQPAEKDTRTQYPAFLANSYFSFSVGSIHYRFSGRQLEPGFRAESVGTPHLAARVVLFGHHFFKHLSAQATYMRPARYVVYESVNGDRTRHEASVAFGGITLVSEWPLSDRLSAYGEGGWGITSRSGFEIDGAHVLENAHFAAGLLGAGFEYHMTGSVDVVFAATFSPGRKAFEQPSTRLFTTGIQYEMRRLPAAQAEDNRRAGFIVPANVIRLGYTTSMLGYGVNHFFSRTIPIFWSGRVETRCGLTVDYQRNVFHTRKRFAFDLGASASYWKSSANLQPFRTLSAYPLFRFFLLRTLPADVYVDYSLAGPTYVTRAVIDDRDTGARLTFQDFMGVGVFLGQNRRMNAEVGIKHYSNGNIFTRNAAIKIPLTFTLGVTF